METDPTFHCDLRRFLFRLPLRLKGMLRAATNRAFDPLTLIFSREKGSLRKRFITVARIEGRAVGICESKAIVFINMTTPAFDGGVMGTTGPGARRHVPRTCG